ncbi:hypothetical protein OG594_02630 [Streptomyces sp. NBC_01214]|uniref:hypothetical protein n=1 Tax=Streptomyces sp. NBC_01214 TaxID=2903777 RepID=UPI00225A97AB|nr:hypothetical protein [Streptomyces sp. NBC_01214]MCX4800577.1 hypothetical protein [Streptomyces sp. NBC_01214]
MTLIAAVPGTWFARFEGREGDDEWGELDGGLMHSEVIAWDGEGFALVVDRETGRLGRAAEREGFAGMCDAVEKAEAETTEEEVLERVQRGKAEREKRERKTGG